MELLRSERNRLALAGMVLLGLAAVFFWQDLDLQPEYLVAVVAALASAAALAQRPRKLPDLGLATLVACCLGGGLWYAGSGNAALLVGVGIAAVGGIGAAVLSYPHASARRRAAFIACSAVVLALVASWALYYRFLTLGVAEAHVARRMVLTLVWLIAGLSAVLAGLKRRDAVWAGAGQLWVAAAVSKAVLYDTTHLGGPLRVVTLAVGGALLLLGAGLAARQAA